MRDTRVPFAAHRYKDARKLAHNRQYAQAETAAQEAVRLDAGLAHAKQFLKYLSIKVAKVENRASEEHRKPAPGRADSTDGNGPTLNPPSSR